MKKIVILFICIFYFQGSAVIASEKHAVKKESKEHSEEAGHDDHENGEDGEHDDHEAHGDGKEEEGHEEASSAVGPGKGITEKSKEGMKLSPQALKVMEIQTGPISGKSMEINQKALVEIKNEKAIYRVRNSWIKRVPVKVLKKYGDKVLIEISNFQSGDLLVTSGVGFVRTAELVAEEGAASGHSH